MPSWAVTIITSLLLKGMDFLTKRDSCSDAVCKIHSGMSEMNHAQKEKLKQQIIVLFGITTEDVIKLTRRSGP